VLKLVIPAGKRVSSAMDGNLKSIHGVWIPAIPAGMTCLKVGFASGNVKLSNIAHIMTVKLTKGERLWRQEKLLRLLGLR